MIAKAKRYTTYFDLHDEQSIKRFILIVLGLLVIVSILARTSLINFQSGDYVTIGSWYDFVKLHGLHSFKYNFSNYNPPFTYFLYIATILPVSKIVAIKSILIVFDIVLAFSVYLLVKLFRPHSYIPLIAALVTMYLPTVLLTGVFAGQFDQLYTAFIFFSLYLGLRDKSKLSWAAFGIAIAIKFQAFFFIPVLAIMSFKRIHWYDIIWGALAFFFVSFPPLIVGRPFMSILNIYPQQTESFNSYLTANAPNLYQWFPLNKDFNYFDHTALGLGLAFSLFVLLISLLYRRFSNRDLVLATTLILYGLPFLLPAMHERYFFPAGIATVILAFTYSTATYAMLAVLAQVITIFTYCPFLFQTMPIQFPILSMATLAIISVLTIQFLKSPRKSTTVT